jgi:hypothetical protein
MGFSLFGKKREDGRLRCVQHYYQIASGACSICGSGLCQECAKRSAVPVCRYCMDNPLTDEERALAEQSGRPARRPRKARKPAGKPKSKAVQAPQPSKVHANRRRLNFDQRQMLRTGAAVVCFSLFGILLVLTLLGKNPFGVVKKAAPPEVVQQQVMTFAFRAVDRIDTYKAKTGKLPRSLEDIGIVDAKSWKYDVLSGDQYVITVTMDGKSFTYNSNQDPAKVFPGMLSVKKQSGR